MKRLYICLWLALWGPAQLLAQVSDPTRATLDNLFAPLDKSQVPTGLLAEDGWLTGSWHPHYKSYLSFRTQKHNI